MSIRIIPEDEIKQAASSMHTPPLLYANPKNLYERRAQRLKQLAENNPLHDYLTFVARVVEAQAELLAGRPIADYRAELNAQISHNGGVCPLDIKSFQRSSEWRDILLQLIDKLSSQANDTILPTLEWLAKASETELESLADHLLNERYHEVGADKAIFIWAALSLYWVQLTQQLPKNTRTEIGEHQHCPVCSAVPVASVIHFGNNQGLRYLHCSLCESEWNVVRAKCSNCEQSGKLDYWSLDKEEAAIKAESCGDCGSYLKILYQEKDPYVEPVADDLASIFLDAEMEEKTFSRSGLNPFLFLSEE